MFNLRLVGLAVVLADLNIKAVISSKDMDRLLVTLVVMGNIRTRMLVGMVRNVLEVNLVPLVMAINMDHTEGPCCREAIRSLFVHEFSSDFESLALSVMYRSISNVNLI